jgi:hypothetical protein
MFIMPGRTYNLVWHEVCSNPPVPSEVELKGELTKDIEKRSGFSKGPGELDLRI